MTLPLKSDDGTLAELAEALKFLGHDAREGHSSTLALIELQRIKPDPMTLLQLMERVEFNARRSLAAIDDFMDLSRARSQPLRCEELDLVDLLVEVVADAWAMASRHGVRVQVAPGPDELMGTVDRELVSGALAKLLRDAVAAVARGVDLSCALRQETQDCVFEISAPLMPVLETDSAADGARRERRVAPGVMLAEVVAGRHGGSLQVLTDAEQRNVRLRLPLRTAAVGA